ncbi:3,9-dihydroxypterocarpan 6A-monooxygenase-like [Typha latifolia]|uniref:3,9-dihydroxypterocarpan 6A-monooxygenase-like n=1 Tax=Typha latifolia TaxID=4733 RepID=UPI003C2BF958
MNERKDFRCPNAMAIEVDVIVEYLNSYVTLSLISLLSIFLIPFFFYRSRAGLRLPPSPFSLPLIGHLHLLAPIPHQALHKLSLRHGPLVHLRLGSVPCIVASSPHTAKQFLKTHGLSFSNRPVSTAVKYLAYNSSDFSFAPYGPYWKFIKKLCMADLLGGRTIEQLKHVRQEEIQTLVKYIFRMAEEGRAFDIGGELNKLTNNIVSMMAMSRRCSGNEREAEEVRKLVEEVAELTGKFNLGDYIWVFKKLDLQGFKKRLEIVHRRFEEMMEGILKEKEEKRRREKEMGLGLGGGEGEKVKDLLDILLDIYENGRAEVRLTRENIKAFILDIFVAGTDTSAITIEWALAELINHPNMLLKASAEIDSVVGRSRLVDESDIPNLPYLQSIVKETLRLHPTAPLIPRESSEDCIIDEYDIPAKTTLFVNVWAIGRDLDYWKDPLNFYPERFVEGEQQATDIRGQHFHMIPFGSGRRTCPGASLALLVIQATLAAMIQCFD